MTLMEVNPTALLHARLLLWILLALVTWSPSCAFDIFSGHPSALGNVNTGAHGFRSGHSVHVEPSVLWWRHKRSNFGYPQLMNSVPPPDHGAFTLPSRDSWRQKIQQGLYGVKVRPADNDVNPPGLPSTYSSNVNPLQLKNMAALSEGMGGKAAAIERLLQKMKTKEAIKEALRRKNNIHEVEKEENELENLMKSPLTTTMLKDLQEFRELDKEKKLFRKHQNMKSRRAKMSLLASHRPHAGPRITLDEEHSGFAGHNRDRSKLSSHKFATPADTGFSLFDSYNDHTAQHYSPPDSLPEVEWFSNPAEKNPQMPSTSFADFSLPSQGSFSSQPLISFPDMPVDQSSLRFPDKFSLSGGFSDEPLGEFFQTSLSDQSFPPSESFSVGLGDATPVDIQGKPDVGMFGDMRSWDVRGFDEDNSHCDTINTRTCVTDDDCKCYGFYRCTQERCRQMTNIKQPSDNVWHEGPIDFGFTKRDLDENKMADTLLQETANSHAGESSAGAMAH